MKWYKEISKVGFRDWYWFVVVLKRDEFSNKLDLKNYYPDLIKLNKVRNRAHRIDSIIG